MRNLLFALLLFIVASCSVTTEGNLSCYRKVCTGDTYIYARTPHYSGVPRSRTVRVIKVTNNYIIIKDDGDGREHKVPPGHLRRHSQDVKVHHPRGNQGRGRGNN